MASMEGMDTMMVYVLTAICFIGLIGCLIWSIYMAIWGIYEEY